LRQIFAYRTLLSKPSADAGPNLMLLNMKGSKFIK
jgi:hypothetical protein